MKQPSIDRFGLDHATVLEQIELLLPGGSVARMRRDRCSHLAKVFARKLRIAMGFVASQLEVPVGYEDETGFHYGTQPAPTTSKEPSLVKA